MSRETARRWNEGKRLSAILAVIMLGPLALTLPYFASAKNTRDRAKNNGVEALSGAALTQDEAIAHALNRLGYGPRPGDIQRIKGMGLTAWIDQQLHPDSLDDSAENARLQAFPTLTMSSGKLLDEFPRPQVAARREGITLEEYRKKQEDQQKEQQAMDLVSRVANDQGDNAAEMVAGEKRDAKAANRSGLLPARLMNYEQNHTPQRIVAELAMSKMDRAIYSERQLNEQMVDFWFNHFNVFANKGQDRWLLTAYERDAIRPHAMGKFRDLLGATAKSPAMLFYLDNWQSVDPEAWARVQRQRAERRSNRLARFGDSLGSPRLPEDEPNPGPERKKQERGLNENYGREVMELHTLGVDGGYTQQDVTEVARCFTGWTIQEPQRNPEFAFDERLHDNKPKLVLGHRITGGGIKDGEEALDLLARDPHTARHLSLEIARHFVSDNPPDALVARMEQTYLATDGDIRSVLHAMIYSPEFWSRDAYHAKIKTPFELVASAARALNAESYAPFALVQWTARIGEPLYQCQPPTGYDDKAETWVNTGALLNRLNYSLALASGRLQGIRVDTPGLLDSGLDVAPEAILDRAIAALLPGGVSPETRATLRQQLGDPQVLQASLDDRVRQVNEGVIAGLVLGSPEFQRK